MRKEGGLRTTGEYKKSYTGKPLISIVTVVRNAKEQLVRTMKSVIHQTYDNIEYIVIDGASTDGTVDVIREFEGAIDYWMSEKDSSVYHLIFRLVNNKHRFYYVNKFILVYSDGGYLLKREPFLIDGSYFRDIEGEFTIHSLLQWIVSPHFKFKDVYFKNSIVKAGTITTDQSITVLTDFIEIKHEENNFKVECFVKDNSSQGYRVFQVRCYNKNRENIKISRFRINGEKKIITMDSQLAHNFFHGKIGNNWKKVGGYILGSRKDENSCKDFFKKENEDEIITKLPVEAKYLRICFVNYKNNGTKTTAWFYSPVMENFKIQ